MIPIAEPMAAPVPIQELSAAQLAMGAQVGVVLAAAGVALAPLTVLAVRRIFPGRNIVFARWGFSHVVAAVFVLVAAQFVIQAAWPEQPGDLVSSLLRSTCQLAVTGAFVLRVAHRVEPDGWRALGLWPGRHGRAALAGLVAYAMSLPLLFGLFAVWPWIVDRLGQPVVAQQALKLFQELPTDELWAPVLLAVVVQPFFEELLFRVFLQPLLVQNLSDKLGVAATSFVFASLHGFAAFLPIFGLSLVLGGVMLRTQRVTSVWAIHALHNAIQICLALAATDAAGAAAH